MTKNWILSYAIFITVLMLVVIIGFAMIRSFYTTRAFVPVVIDNSTTPNPNIASEPELTDIQEEPLHTTPSSSQYPTEPPDESSSAHDRSFSFVVLADSDNYNTASGHNDILEQILAVSAKLTPDLALFSGDLVTMPDASLQKLTSLKKLIEKYHKNYYIAFGKHDVECGDACVLAWQQVFFDQERSHNAPKELYHSFDHENVHFILLSSDHPLKHGVDDAQFAWLEKDLAQTTQEHIIVVSHVPPVNFFTESTKECHDMTCDESRRARLQDLFTAHHVDLVISGHEHVFDHKIVAQTDYVLAGNIGNGKRYKDTLWQNSFLHILVKDAHITLMLRDEHGTLLQQKSIK